MAVASNQSIPYTFFEADWTAYSIKLSNTSSVETSSDSDDEYDYVASLAEQIAHAMLDDDDDCSEDTDQNSFVSCTPTEAQATVYGPRLCNSNATSKDFPARINSNPLSTEMLLPLCRADSNQLSSDLFGKIPDCKFAAVSAFPRASSLGEPGFFAYGASESSPLVRRDSLPHSRRQFQAEFVPVAQRQSIPEKYVSLTVSAPTDKLGRPPLAANTSSSITVRESSSMRHYHDWQPRNRELSNSRSRHGARRKNELTKNVRAGLLNAQAFQPSAPRWQSPLLELRDSVGAHATLPGHYPARAEPTGTGVFLPRISCSGSSHRRKSESVTVVSKSTDSVNNAHLRGGRQRERVHLHSIATAL